MSSSVTLGHSTSAMSTGPVPAPFEIEVPVPSNTPNKETTSPIPKQTHQRWPRPPTSTLRRASSESSLTAVGATTANKALPTRNDLLGLPRRPAAQFDEARAAAFAQRIVNGVNDAATCLMLSLGHQLGLFSALLGLRAATAGDLARSLGLAPRYVAEWLASMVCAGLVWQEAGPTGAATYALRGAAGAYVAAGGACNMALVARYVPALGRLEDDVAECFRSGGGLPRGKYAELDEVASRDCAQTVGERLDGVLGQSARLRERLGDGVCVACVGGNADAVYVRLAQTYERSWFTVYARCAGQVEEGKRGVVAGGVTNVHFREMGDLVGLRSFDAGLVFDGAAVRQDWGCLKALRGAIRAGGVVVYAEVFGSGGLEEERGNDIAPLMGTFAAMRALPEARWGGGDVGKWGHVEAEKRLAEAGFERIRVCRMEGDEINCVLVAEIGDCGE